MRRGFAAFNNHEDSRTGGTVRSLAQPTSIVNMKHAGKSAIPNFDSDGDFPTSFRVRETAGRQ